MRRVVVTGMGTVGAYGAGRDALGDALASGKTNFTAYGDAATDVANDSALPPQPATRGRCAKVDETLFDEWLPRRSARRLSVASRAAVVAARMAISDADLDADVIKKRPQRTGIYLGTAFGSPQTTEQLLTQILRQSPADASPFLFMESVLNAPAAQVALALAARGPNSTVAQREASGILAVAQGARDIAHGRIDRAIVGAVDEISALTVAVLERFKACTAEELPRPFCRTRSGMATSSGATIWVLEAQEIAEQRAAANAVEITGTIRAHDPTAPDATWGCGAPQLASQLADGLHRLDVPVEAIDCIVASASGSVRGDRLEAQIIEEVWAGKNLPPVVAPKGITGEYGGGFLGAALLAAEGQPIAGPPGFRQADEGLNVQPYAGVFSQQPKCTIVSSLASGGAAAWMVLQRT